MSRAVWMMRVSGARCRRSASRGRWTTRSHRVSQPFAAKSSHARCMRLPTGGCKPPPERMQLAADERGVAVLDVHDLAAVGGAEAEHPQAPAEVVEPVHVRRRVRAVGVGERPRRGAEHDVGAERDQRAPARIVRIGGQHPVLGVGRGPVEVGVDRRRRGGQHRRLGPGEHRRLVAVRADDQRDRGERPRGRRRPDAAAAGRRHGSARRPASGVARRS